MIENTDTHTHLSDAIRYDVHSKEQVDADLKVLDEVFTEVKRLREEIRQKNYQIENWKWELDKRMHRIDYEVLIEEMKQNE
jgi:hypothetical protein